MKAFLSLFVLVGATVGIVTSDEQKEASAKEFFGHNADCKVVKDAKDEVLVRGNLPIHLPNIGMTAVTTETHLSGLNGDLKKFYVDDETGNLIMTFDYTTHGIFCDAPDSYFAVHQKGKEPKVVKEKVNATYYFELTAEIPPINKRITAKSLKEARYYAYFQDSESSVFIGPKVTQSHDPVIQKACHGLVYDLPTALKLIMRTKAKYIFLADLQNRYCDFNLNPALNGYDLTVFNNLIGVDVDNVKNFDTSKDKRDKTDVARDYFKKNGQCSGVTTPDEEPFERQPSVHNMPYINSTVVYPYSRISGLNGAVEQFYINQESNHLVMSVVYKDIVMEAPECELYIHKRGAPSKRITEHNEDHYRDVTLTAVVNLDNGLTADAMQKAFVTHTIEGKTAYKLGEDFTDSEDQDMQKIMEVIRNDPNRIGDDLVTSEALGFLITYVQKYMCDFGIPL